MTLEDETGFVNLVVWAQVFAEFATIIKTTSLLGVTGRLQVQEGIVHLIAERVWHPAAVAAGGRRRQPRLPLS